MSTETKVMLFVASLTSGGAFCLVMALFGSYWLAGAVACLAFLCASGSTAATLSGNDK